MVMRWHSRRGMNKVYSRLNFKLLSVLLNRKHTRKRRGKSVTRNWSSLGANDHIRFKTFKYPPPIPYKKKCFRLCSNPNALTEWYKTKKGWGGSEIRSEAKENETSQYSFQIYEYYRASATIFSSRFFLATDWNHQEVSKFHKRNPWIFIENIRITDEIFQSMNTKNTKIWNLC